MMNSCFFLLGQSGRFGCILHMIISPSVRPGFRREQITRTSYFVTLITFTGPNNPEGSKGESAR